MASGELIIDEEEDADDQTQIKVVGLGLGRAGTTSLVMALEMLGYFALLDDEETELTDILYVVEEGTIDSDEFHEILGLRGYNASFKTEYEWVQSHEEVKAILPVRDTPEKYVDSCSCPLLPFLLILWNRFHSDGYHLLENCVNRSSLYTKKRSRAEIRTTT